MGQGRTSSALATNEQNKVTGTRPLPSRATATTSQHLIVFESFPWDLERSPSHLPGPWLPGLLKSMGGKERKRSEKDLTLGASLDWRMRGQVLEAA